MQEKREEARRKAAEARKCRSAEEAQRNTAEASTGGEAEAAPEPTSPDALRNGSVVTPAKLRALLPSNRRSCKPDEDPDRDVAPWLRALGCRNDEIRRGMELCEAIPDASMEEKLKYALKGLKQGLVRRISFATPAPAVTSTP